MFFKCLIIFLCLFTTGIFLSQRKIVWSDEFFTQSANIDKHSYLDLASMNFNEGNRSPIFYLIQKAVADGAGYHFPVEHIQGLTKVRDPQFQVLMRLPSNVYMSLALTLIFCFFATRFSLLTGAMVIATALTAPMVWQYWLEARPYSLWFLLTVIQLLVLFQIKATGGKLEKWGKALIIVHLFLILTTVASILQIICAALLLFLNKETKRLAYWAGGLAAGIFIFYFIKAPLFTMKVYTPLVHLFENMPPEHLLLFLSYGISLYLFRKPSNPTNRFAINLGFLLLAGAVVVLFYYATRPSGQFQFDSRYLIYLVPIDICLMGFAFNDTYYWVKGNYPVFAKNVIIFFAGLLIIRGLLTYKYILSIGLFLHSPG